MRLWKGERAVVENVPQRILDLMFQGYTPEGVSKDELMMKLSNMIVDQEHARLASEGEVICKDCSSWVTDQFLECSCAIVGKPSFWMKNGDGMLVKGCELSYKIFEARLRECPDATPK